MEHTTGRVSDVLDRRERNMIRSLIDLRLHVLTERANEHIGRGIEPSDHDESERADLYRLRTKVTG